MSSLKCCTFHLPKSSDSLIQSLCSIFKAKYYLPKPKVFQREKIPWQTKQMVVYRSTFYLVLQVTWLRGKVQCIWPAVCFHTRLFSWTLLTNTCFMSSASFCSTVSQFRRLEAIGLHHCIASVCLWRLVWEHCFIFCAWITIVNITQIREMPESCCHVIEVVRSHCKQARVHLNKTANLANKWADICSLARALKNLEQPRNETVVLLKCLIANWIID